ncbi:MAG: glycosyltransferase, partial [Hungatella sp.]
MFNKIAAIVVFYHPPKEVINNILTYSKDISNVIVIDNSEEGVDKNKGYVDQLMKKNPDRSFHYHSMGENKGLAEAFNFGLELADLLGCDWCFTMDSDSSFQNDIVSVYQNAERKYADSKVIAYAPQYDYDRIILRKSNRVETTIWSMTSGTMFHIKKTIEAGG